MEESSRFVLTAELPGVNPQDVEIEVEGRVLSIRGEKKVEREVLTLEIEKQAESKGRRIPVQTG